MTTLGKALGMACVASLLSVASLGVAQAAPAAGSASSYTKDTNGDQTTVKQPMMSMKKRMHHRRRMHRTM